VLAGWEGFTHDALILFDALERTEGISEHEKIIDHFNAELSFEANARKIINIIGAL